MNLNRIAGDRCGRLGDRVLESAGRPRCPLFGAPGDVTADLQAVPFLGCSAADFAGFAAGSIALIARGTCAFSEKILNANAAGAVAALISNDNPGGAFMALR
jgi:hypothetical protein